MTTKIIYNENITAKNIRLIDNETMIGVVSLSDALSRARSRGLDVIAVANLEDEIPICKIGNADKWRYERAKNERENAKRKRDLEIETKEIQLRPVTNENDIAIKARKAQEILNDGDKVKVIVRFKGREKTHRDEGKKIVEQFMVLIGDHTVIKPISDGESDISLVIGSTRSKAEILNHKEHEK